MDYFPHSLASVPFTWVLRGEQYAMKFYSGFLSIVQDTTTFALRPMISWAMVDAEEQEKAKAAKSSTYSNYFD